MLVHSRVQAGLKRAVAQGKRLGPGAEPEKMARARAELAKGIGKLARIVGLGTGTVHRLKREMTAGD